MPRTVSEHALWHSVAAPDVHKDHRDVDTFKEAQESHAKKLQEKANQEQKEKEQKAQKDDQNKEQKAPKENENKEQKDISKDNKQQEAKDDQKDNKNVQKETKKSDDKEDKDNNKDNANVKASQSDKQADQVATDVTDPGPRRHQMARLQNAPEGARDKQEPMNEQDPDKQKTASAMDSESEKDTDRRAKGPQKDTSEKDERLQKGNANLGPGQQTEVAGKHDLMPQEKAPQGADESKPVRNKLPEPTKEGERAGGVKNSERKDHQKKLSPAEERKLKHEQSLAHHPHLYEELERRKRGQTPLETLEHLEDVDFEKNDLEKQLKRKEENADEAQWLKSNFKDAREKRREEERAWRDANKRGLNNLHDIQQWQRRETEDYERVRQWDERENDNKDQSILGSIGSFASDKWHSLAHGNEDKSDKRRNEFEGRERAALGERTNVRQGSPVQKPGTPVRKETTSPLRQEEPAKRSWWPFSWGQSGELRHMSGWKENTRLIDTMTDDELSMMAL